MKRINDVSIIIVNYNSGNLIIDCVNSIYEKTKETSFEIIIVDNYSKDDSVRKLNDSLGKKVSIILSNENLGFGKANNLGAKHAKGEYLFLLNPDTVLINDAISILVKYLKQHNDTGIAGGNLFTLDKKPTPSFCIQFDDLMLEKERAKWSYLISSKISQKRNSNKNNKIDEFNYTNSPQKVAYIFGADIMIKKSLFDEIGGFDPDFFMYAEEEEMSWRITQKGYSIYSVPQAEIIHLEGATTSVDNSFSERQFRMRMNGTMMYYLKRYGIDGVKMFYKYRIRRYSRLVNIAKIQGKLTSNFGPLLQKKLLNEEYSNFIKE